MSSNNLLDLSGLRRLKGLSEIRSFASVGSTNDEALAWAAEGASDLSLVFADEQLAGRGRMGRKWFTPPGSALAFSLILRPQGEEREQVAKFSGLGALALVRALQKLGISAQIKWPNDVLVQGKKLAGILVETVWMGADVDSVVLGMGVNVTPDSLPPASALTFPATCIQAEGVVSLSRADLLTMLLEELIALRAGLPTEAFIAAWQQALAFRGEMVQVWVGETESVIGQVLGLETDGSLRVALPEGGIRAIRFGEVHLRPV